MKTDLHLTLHETSTTAWQRLKAHYESELKAKRARLECTGATNDERTALCWQIDMIKRFLAHGEEAKKNGAGAG